MHTNACSITLRTESSAGRWLAWIDEHFQASERTARNYMEMEIAKTATVADLHEDTTMRSALRALTSRSQTRQTESRSGNGRANGTPAEGQTASRDDTRVLATATVTAPRAGLNKTHQRTWANVPTRLTTITQVFNEAADEHLDDHRASEALHRASREAHQAAIELEQLADALEKRAAPSVT